ncbi:MAG: primosomal protein N' [Bacteroidia bacterium]
MPPSRQSQLQLQDPEQDDRNTFFVNVLLPFALRKTFTYRVPYEMNNQLSPGRRVVVQFGKKKLFTGLIVAIHQIPPVDYTAKYLITILDNSPIVNDRQIAFWQWMASYYCTTAGEIMSAALPANMKLASETRIIPDETYEGDYAELPDKEYFVAEALEKEKELTISQISEILDQKSVMHIIKRLLDEGVVQIKEQLIRTYKPKTVSCVRLAPGLEAAEKQKKVFAELEKAPKQLEVFMNFLVLKQKKKHVEQKVLLKNSNTTSSTLNALSGKGILEVYPHQVGRVLDVDVEQHHLELAPFQETSLLEIKAAYREKQVVLLKGVTGSGKTHIYVKLIREAIAQGKQAMYIVPEIALTTQLITRLKSFFGKRIGIYHSKFSDNERVEIWMKLLKKEYDVVLGVRSALFLPFSNLGIVVVDEEHENTYKQHEPSPRYHARDSAIYLASLHQAKCLLGTATPSFESYHNVKMKKYGFSEINARFTAIEAPEIVLADLKQEKQRGTMKSHFSSLLLREMRTVLEQKEQVILFQNRRGYSPYLECQTCGWVPQCRNCDISLTYHKAIKQLRCHYCGHYQPVPVKCKACGNPSIMMKGFGTEKLEDELEIYFPDARILRMDQDTTRRKNALHRIISRFESGDADILVGTQMVTKGLDFKNVRLVGIMSADQMLSYPDFRAYERSFQLMAQVSGRAGRRKKRGKVVVQTFQTEHPIFQYLIKNDFEGFYQQQAAERNMYHYPPYFRLIKIVVKETDIEIVKTGSEELARRLRKHFAHEVLGPEFPPVARIRNKYQMNILLKFPKSTSVAKAKETIIHETDAFKNEKKFSKLHVIIDVDPV